VSDDPHKDWRAAHDAYCLEGGVCFTPGQSDCATLSRIAGLKAAQRHMPPDPTLGIPMVLTCPSCGGRHIDEGEFATKPHHTHACQHCGMVWRPAIGPTVGVQFLPGFKNGADA
jgi:rubredoxin